MAREKPKTNPTINDLFEAHVFTGKNRTSIPYRLLRPEKLDPAKQYPLIVFLHGGGERGTDNKAQLAHCVNDFSTPKVRATYPCYLAAPQCPSEETWIKAKWTLPRHTMERAPLPSLGMVLAMIPALVKELPQVDAGRVYAAGISMGGFGAWELLQRAPQLFAAGVIICGGGDEGQAKQIAKVPVWAFHGELDTVVKPARTVNMVEAVKKAGGEVKLTMYKNVAHESWTRVFRDPAVIDWLFAQNKNK